MRAQAVPTDIVSILRKKYGDSLSREHINCIDITGLSEIEKESLRKLKISIANKGRKPWNVGKRHSPDTVQRIRDRTRLAMRRSDVRERWEASWEPKAHTQKTKEKLQAIMRQKEKEKLAWMTEWLREEMGINLCDYENLSPRFRDAYRRAFNIKWRIRTSKTIEKKRMHLHALHKANLQILRIHASETKRQNRASELRKKSENQKKAKLGGGKALSKSQVVIQRKNYASKQLDSMAISSQYEIKFDSLSQTPQLITRFLDKEPRLNTHTAHLSTHTQSRLRTYGKTIGILDTLIEKSFRINNNCSCQTKEIQLAIQIAKERMRELEVVKNLSENCVFTCLYRHERVQKNSDDNNVVI